MFASFRNFGGRDLTFNIIKSLQMILRFGFLLQGSLKEQVLIIEELLVDLFVLELHALEVLHAKLQDD